MRRQRLTRARSAGRFAEQTWRRTGYDKHDPDTWAEKFLRMEPSMSVSLQAEAPRHWELAFVDAPLLKRRDPVFFASRHSDMLFAHPTPDVCDSCVWSTASLSCVCCKEILSLIVRVSDLESGKGIFST